MEDVAEHDVWIPLNHLPLQLMLGPVSGFAINPSLWYIS